MGQTQFQTGIRSSDSDLMRPPFVSYASMPLGAGERPKPGWLRTEGLCFVGCWETLPWRRYSGIATTWAEEDYAFEHSPEFLQDIVKLGCNAVVVPYDCGHGEELNEEDVRKTRELILLAHSTGLKVGTYFRPDAVWIETLSDRELEELEGGFQINAQGRFVHPFGAAARNLCYHHPGVLSRLKRHIQRAITELETDMLHLDGMIIGDLEGSGACRCPNCAADFCRFLVERYGSDREVAKRRFGHQYIEKVVPPANYPIDFAPFDTGPVQPNWAEWMAFRCYWTSRILSQVAAWTVELNPEVAIEINNALPAARENAALWMGTDVIGIGHYTDASWSEDAYGPELHSDGTLTQRVRQFKLCRAVDTFALTYMSERDERAVRQNLAHTAAFNGGNIGCIGFPPRMNYSNDYTVHSDVKREFMRWLNQHRPYFRNTKSAAQIAVWRPRENMAMSGSMAYAATMRVEQLLIESCLGFDFVFDESPLAFSEYDLVIVPNVECIDLGQIEGLIGYVDGGGSLLVGQDSAAFDLWHRRRVENPWSGIFGEIVSRTTLRDAVAATPAGAFVEAQSQARSREVARTTFGLGRAAYISDVVDPASQPSMLTVHGGLNTGLDYTNWTPPENLESIARAIDWLMEGKERFHVTAERGMLAEFLSQDDPKRMLIHLVNLCPQPQHRCTVEFFSKTRDIDVLYPATDRPPEWRVEHRDQSTKIAFNLLDAYAVVVLPT